MDRFAAMNTVRWFKSSRSASNGECVEVALLGDRVAVRDSKDAGAGMLTVDTAHWRAFVTGIRRGAFGV